MVASHRPFHFLIPWHPVRKVRKLGFCTRINQHTQTLKQGPTHYHKKDTHKNSHTHRTIHTATEGHTKTHKTLRLTTHTNGHTQRHTVYTANRLSAKVLSLSPLSLWLSVEVLLYLLHLWTTHTFLAGWGWKNILGITWVLDDIVIKTCPRQGIFESNPSNLMIICFNTNVSPYGLISALML